LTRPTSAAPARPRLTDERRGGPPRHVAKNRAYWDRESDAYQRLHAEQIGGGLAWGVWQIPEAELNVLGDVGGLDVLELGCGAAQWSIALAALGARPIGLDFSPRQLAHAAEAQRRAGLEFPLVEASAEDVPLADESFDVVFCDHGAFNFADPRRLVPESARLLRGGGLLAFNVPSPLLDLFWDVEGDTVGDRLRNDYFGLHGFEDADTVEFQLPYGEWIRLLASSGFEIEDLIETQAPNGATSSYDLVSAEWARRWPAENIWKARKPKR
jgi:SAM-dependent methyltransferase